MSMLGIKHEAILGLKSVRDCEWVASINEGDYTQHKSTIHFGDSRVQVMAWNREMLLQQTPTVAALAYN